MPGFVVRPPGDSAAVPDGDRARPEPTQAARNPVLRLAPVMFAPAAAAVVLIAETAAVVRLIVGFPRLAVARPTGR